MRSIPIDPARLSLAFIDAAPVARRHPDTRQVLQGQQAESGETRPTRRARHFPATSGSEPGRLGANPPG